MGKMGCESIAGDRVSLAEDKKMSREKNLRKNCGGKMSLKKCSGKNYAKKNVAGKN